jgi:acetylornithine deacetylase
MKGFIAACIAMAPELAAQVRNRPLHFAFTHDEEVGCLGAQALVDILRDKPFTPGVAIIGEPTEMRIIEGHKGCCEYTTHFHGLAGHGSTPERGVNAVEYAVRYVSRLLDLRTALKGRAPAGSPFSPPWTTINPGALHGGVAHNVIAETASVEWEMRPVQDSDARFVRGEMQNYVDTVLLPEMQAIHPGAAIHTEVIGEVAGLEPADENLARDIVAELTGANGADVVAFGTEAGLFADLGMSAVVCGPGSIEQAHKADEFIAREQLAQCLTMLERLGGQLG